VAGYFIAFKVQQNQVKEEIESEIKAGVNTKDLTTITINKTDIATIHWTDSNKEMRYKDDLYDIVKSSETATTITYYCLNDTKEESLIADLNTHINTHVVANKTNKNSKKSVDNIVKLYFMSKDITVSYSSLSSLNYLPFNVDFTSTVLEKNAPPPEFV
jgi:predicted P-loop ATPase/GTPase